MNLGEHVRAVQTAREEGYESGYIAGLQEAEKLTGIGLASVIAAARERFEDGKKGAT